jgi:hypothetical protein
MGMNKPTTTYTTILRIGHLGRIDAQRTSNDDHVHTVKYRLIDSHGGVTQIGYAGFTGDTLVDKI